ncbi:hypothetical protein ABZK47_004485 [Salmonella enterica]|nr:hypothetical protein [Salmonella enterica]ECQ0176073.1 hypothetical protein [Salmonella enterica]EDS4261241.1 hypothetical protein [Salmonella enterica]EFT3069773.1 hypothetical protein [Salmonella enterica]EHO5902610.1 hypothetical protein [Salmonella enterica]
MKNQQTEKKIQKTLVQKNGIPIMRLHRHGGCESLQTAGRLKRKILKFRVDSERGKRNIRHLATVSESRVALLFNNLSDNLCGHSKIRILNVARRKMNTKSQE